MKLLTTLSVSLFLTGTCALAQPMRATDYYLSNLDVSANAKDIYNSGFKAPDDSKTHDVIDSICGKNKNTRPFYLYLASNMAITAEGSVRAMLAAECRQLTEAQPNAVIEFLTTDRKEVPVAYYKRWAALLAEAYMNSCCGGEFTDKRVTTGLRTARLNCRSNNRQELTTLYNEVRAKVCENEVLDRVQELPEVCALNMKAKQGKDEDVTIGVYAGPQKCANYYWVKVWKGNTDDAPVYDFCVDPETFDVFYYDVHSERILDLTTWRQKLQ